MKEVGKYVVVKMDAGWDQETRTGVRRTEGFGEEYGLAWGTQGEMQGTAALGQSLGKCRVSHRRTRMCWSWVSQRLFRP